MLVTVLQFLRVRALYSQSNFVTALMLGISGCGVIVSIVRHEFLSFSGN